MTFADDCFTDEGRAILGSFREHGTSAPALLGTRDPATIRGIRHVLGYLQGTCLAEPALGLWLVQELRNLGIDIRETIAYRYDRPDMPSSWFRTEDYPEEHQLGWTILDELERSNVLRRVANTNLRTKALEERFFVNKAELDAWISAKLLCLTDG